MHHLISNSLCSHPDLSAISWKYIHTLKRRTHRAIPGHTEHLHQTDSNTTQWTLSTVDIYNVPVILPGAPRITLISDDLCCHIIATNMFNTLLSPLYNVKLNMRLSICKHNTTRNPMTISLHTHKLYGFYLLILSYVHPVDLWCWRYISVFRFLDCVLPGREHCWSETKVNWSRR